MVPRTVRLTFREPPPGSDESNSGIPIVPLTQTVASNVASDIGWQCRGTPREEISTAEYYNLLLDTERQFAFTPDIAVAPIVENHWKARLEVVKQWPRMPPDSARAMSARGGAGDTLIELGMYSFVRSPEMVQEYYFGKSLMGESLSSAYAHVLEYDLDEQDLHWLALANAERAANKDAMISQHDMALLMDCFEKGWFALSRASQRLYARNLNAEAENAALPCAICRETETSLDNIIVICDGCNTAVHQDCYGVPLVPEGPWFCQRCVYDGSQSCAVCPWTFGPMQLTSDKNKPWIHATCAEFLKDEIPVPSSGEPRKLSGILPARWRLSCGLCNSGDRQVGAPIQCAFKNCCASFHLYCAEASRCKIDWKTRVAFCIKHSGIDDKAANARRAVDVAAINAELSVIKCRNVFQNPTVPEKLIDAILKDSDALCDFLDDEDRRRDVMHIVSRYWALKKARVRGAPLVKCLDVDPWSNATNASIIREKRMIYADLKWVEHIASLVALREKCKRTSLVLALDLLRTSLQPLQTIMFLGCKAMREADSKEFFESPVLASEVPDYYDIVKQPCCMQLVVQRVREHKYTTLEEMFADLKLIHDNAVLYNEAGTMYHLAAISFWEAACKLRPLLSSALAQTKKAPFLNAKINAVKAILGPLLECVPGGGPIEHMHDSADVFIQPFPKRHKAAGGACATASHILPQAPRGSDCLAIKNDSDRVTESVFYIDGRDSRRAKSRKTASSNAGLSGRDTILGNRSNRANHSKPVLTRKFKK